MTSALESSVRYLESPAAIGSIDIDPYWPKWDAPWWHMTLLWESGEAERIPRAALDKLIAVMNERIVRVFPIRPGQLPPGKNAARDVACHCQLGTLDSILGARGYDIDRELPWVRPWYSRYQMPDGGLSCIEGEYAAARGPDEDPCSAWQPGAPVASSMVGTIPPLEAVLRQTHRPLTPAEERFVDRGAAFLIGRGLVRGSHDEEREDEADWRQPCFPRFYFYDVLRGLSWLLEWSERRRKPLPRVSIARALAALPDFEVRAGRRSTEGATTRIIKSPKGGLDDPRRPPASRFAALDAVERVGEASPWLSAQRRDALERLTRLERAHLIS